MPGGGWWGSPLGLASTDEIRWANSSGVFDTGLKRGAAGFVYVTDGQSGSGGMRVGNGTAANPSYGFTNGAGEGLFLTADGVITVATGGSDTLSFVSASLRLRSTTNFGWSSGASGSTSLDLTLERDGADALAQRRAANAQSYRIYNTWTDASNYERVTVGVVAANTFGLLGSAAGTGASRAMLIGTDATSSGALSVQTGGTTRWTFGGSSYALTSLGNGRFAHGTSALATSATEGFFHLQSCAGVPTGTPASIPTGQIPMVLDSNADQLNFFSTSWKALPRVLSVNSTAVGNVGGGTDDLMTFVIPANVLVTTNKCIRIKAWGTTANNATGKTITFVVGSQTVLTTALTASIAGQWEVEVNIIRTGSNTQDIRARTLQGATLIFDQELTAGTQTETATITVKMTGAAGANDDIVQEGMIVEVIN